MDEVREFSKWILNIQDDKVRKANDVDGDVYLLTLTHLEFHDHICTLTPKLNLWFIDKYEVIT